jgi:hypothetical protein
MKQPKYIANREAAETALVEASGKPKISKRSAVLIMDAIIAGRISGVRGVGVSRPVDKRGLQYKIEVLTERCEQYMSEANGLRNALKQEKARIHTLRSVVESTFTNSQAQIA